MYVDKVQRWNHWFTLKTSMFVKTGFWVRKSTNPDKISENISTWNPDLPRKLQVWEDSSLTLRTACCRFHGRLDTNQKSDIPISILREIWWQGIFSGLKGQSSLDFYFLIHNFFWGELYRCPNYVSFLQDF